MIKKFNIKEWQDKYLKEGSLDSDSVSTMLDIAARWSSTQDQAANQTWDDEQELYDYLKSDHIHKKYHKDFYKAVERAFTKNRVHEAKVPLNEGSPSWYKSFEKQLADKLDVEVRDLWMKQVDPHLIKVGADFSQQGLDNFPSAVNSLLRTPKFKGKMVFVKNEKIEDKIVEKHPNLEDYIYDDGYFWIYIK